MDTEHWKNFVLEKILLIFKSNLPPEADVTEKLKAGTVYLIFHVVFKNKVAFDAALWESTAFTSLFSKIKIEYFENNFFSLPSREKNAL